MLSVDGSNLARLEDDLEVFASKALPFATRHTLNSAAFHAQKAAKSYVKSSMTTRNNYTMQSIRVEQSKTLDIDNQKAVVGSTADYMDDQERGKVKTGGNAIATSYSAGQGESEKRTKLARKSNALRNIKLSRSSRKAKNRKQRNLFRMQDAIKSGNRQVYMKLGRRKGIFKIVGGSKKFKRGLPKNMKIKMLHDMTSNTVVIPRSPWLSSSVDATQPLIFGMYEKALRFQLKRNKILGY